LPWLKSDDRVYEDWYIMTNFASLDALDQLVFKNKRVPSHRALMTRTGRASGAVMYLENGTPYVERSRIAYWFSRPRTASVDDSPTMANPAQLANAASLWTRAMALGPAGNCLLVDEAISLPPAIRAIETCRDLFWAP